MTLLFLSLYKTNPKLLNIFMMFMTNILWDKCKTLDYRLTKLIITVNTKWIEVLSLKVIVKM